MQARSFIVRCTAFFLLLVFAQKSGAGLLLHDVLHTSQTGNEFAGKEAKEISLACSCIDDFLMPFAEPVQPAVAVIAEMQQATSLFFADDVIFYTPVLASLRGPPSCIL
jgi:hypothetical protein